MISERIIRFHRPRPSERTIRVLVDQLRQERLAVVPSETQYALCALATSTATVANVRRLKDRSEKQPLSAFFRHTDDVARWGIHLDGYASVLARQFWPGPLTLVLPATGGLGRRLGSPGTVGVRISPEPIIVQMLESLDQPVIATSANPSGELLSIKQENRWLQSLAAENRILWLRPGRYTRRPASTVIDCTQARPRELRAGSVPRAVWVQALK